MLIMPNISVGTSKCWRTKLRAGIWLPPRGQIPLSQGILGLSVNIQGPLSIILTLCLVTRVTSKFAYLQKSVGIRRVSSPGTRPSCILAQTSSLGIVGLFPGAARSCQCKISSVRHRDPSRLGPGGHAGTACSGPKLPASVWVPPGSSDPPTEARRERSRAADPDSLLPEPFTVIQVDWKLKNPAFWFTYKGWPGPQ